MLPMPPTLLPGLFFARRASTTSARAKKDVLSHFCKPEILFFAVLRKFTAGMEGKFEVRHDEENGRCIESFYLSVEELRNSPVIPTWKEEEPRHDDIPWDDYLHAP